MSFPLHTASKDGNAQQVQFLIQRIRQISPNHLNILINQLDSNGLSPLHWSSMQNHLPIVQLLLSNGANVNLQDNESQESPLGYASSNEDLDIVEYLVQNGANVNQPNNEGRTPIFNAVIGGQEDVIQFLITNGANVNYRDNDGKTPLMLAASEGFLNVVHTLVNNGANINDIDNLHRSPLIHAILAEHTAEDDDELFENEDDHLDIVRYLISHGANPNLVESTNKTPLHYAVIKDFSFIVEYLLTIPSVNINARDNANRTPLSYAVQLGTQVNPNVNARDIAKMLLEKNATIDNQLIPQITILLPEVPAQRAGAALYLRDLENVFVREGNTIRRIPPDIAYLIRSQMPTYTRPRNI